MIAGSSSRLIGLSVGRSAALCCRKDLVNLSLLVIMGLGKSLSHIAHSESCRLSGLSIVVSVYLENRLFSIVEKDSISWDKNKCAFAKHKHNTHTVSWHISAQVLVLVLCSTSTHAHL